MKNIKDLFQLLLIVIICTFTYFLFLFLFTKIFLEDPAINSAVALGSLFGAFFAFLFIRIGDFFVKLYKNLEENYNGLILFHRALSENILIANNNIYYASLIIETLKKGNRSINVLSKFILVDEIIDKIKNLEFANEAFSLSINLKGQNDNIEMMNGFYAEIKSSFSLEKDFDVEKYKAFCGRVMEGPEALKGVYTVLRDKEFINILAKNLILIKKEKLFIIKIIHFFSGSYLKKVSEQEIEKEIPVLREKWDKIIKDENSSKKIIA